MTSLRMTRIVAAVWSALVGIVTPAAAQHEHHGVPSDSARVLLDAVTTRAERVAVELRSGATVVHARAARRRPRARDAAPQRPLRSDRLEFRIADAAFTQESRRRTARTLLSLFASYAVGGAPREDAPVRTEGSARIF